MQTPEQNDKPTGKPLLPLVRLGLILPFVEEMDRWRVDADAVLMSNALVRETVCDPNVFVPAKVRLQVCDPAAIPECHLGIRIVGGDRMGMLVRFPTEWLFKALDLRALIRGSMKNGPPLHVPVAFLDALRQTLLLHLQDADLGVDIVARLSGMSRQSLQRRLKASGTTLSEQIVEVKKQRAGGLLVETDRSVVEVATALGFTNPTSFARAFKSWTGESPREYRKHRRSG